MDYYNTRYGKFVTEPEDGVCKAVREGRFWDEWILPHLDGLNKDCIAVDIGASVGQMTIYMAQKCKWVHSFEPQIINYDRLVINAKLNNIENISTYNVALYNKNCKMAVNNIINQKDVNYGAVQACSLQLFENEMGDIEAKTLDSYNIEKVDFIKIDAEESDGQVIQGSIETIKRCRPAIIFECGSLKTLNGIKEIFKSLNYNVKEVAGQNYLASP